MGRPRGQAAANQTRQVVLTAAEQEFARRGFDATRLEDVAGAAGITRPSLLHHFESKQVLYEAVIHGAFTRLGSALAVPVESPLKFPQQLDAVMDAFAFFLDSNPAIAKLLLREVLDDRGPGRTILKSEVVPLLDWLQAWIESAGDRWMERGIPVRASIMQVVADGLLRSAADSLRTPFWGKGNHGRTLARRLLLKR